MSKTTRKLQRKDILNTDEIDLNPFIKRVLTRKWIILFVTIISGIIGYFASMLLPLQYQVTGSLRFKGYRRIEGTDSTYVQLPIIMPSSTSSLVDQIDSLNKDELDDVSSLSIIGSDFPQQLSFVIEEGADINAVSNTIINGLNNNRIVQSELESQRTFLSDRLESTNSAISDVDNQISSARQVGFNCSAESAALGSAYADLAALKEDLESTKVALQMELNSLVGYEYVTEPYITNNGKPISPKLLQNAAIAAFTSSILAFMLSAIVKTKDERKQ